MFIDPDYYTYKYLYSILLYPYYRFVPLSPIITTCLFIHFPLKKGYTLHLGLDQIHQIVHGMADVSLNVLMFQRSLKEQFLHGLVVFYHKIWFGKTMV